MLIRWAALGFILGQFLLALAAAMLLPIAWGVFSRSGGIGSLVGSALLTAACGGSLGICSRSEHLECVKVAAASKGSKCVRTYGVGELCAKPGGWRGG